MKNLLTKRGTHQIGRYGHLKCYEIYQKGELVRITQSKKEADSCKDNGMIVKTKMKTRKEIAASSSVSRETALYAVSRGCKSPWRIKYDNFNRNMCNRDFLHPGVKIGE